MLNKFSSALGSLGKSIERANEATQEFNRAAQGALDKIPRSRKARFPVFPVRSRKQRLRRWRHKRRNIARRMHELQGDFIQAIIRDDGQAKIQITKASAEYLTEAVAHITVLRLFEKKFSGPREHVIRQLEHIRRKHKSRCAPFTGQSGHAALRHSFLVRRDAERSRLDKLQSAAGAGFGIIV